MFVFYNIPVSLWAMENRPFIFNDIRASFVYFLDLTGCGKTLHGCHPERSLVPYGAGRSEGSRSAYLLENAQGQILRFALHRTVRDFAQNDSFEEFFRSLLVCCPISNWH